MFGGPLVASFALTGALGHLARVAVPGRGPEAVPEIGSGPACQNASVTATVDRDPVVFAELVLESHLRKASAGPSVYCI